MSAMYIVGIKESADWLSKAIKIQKTGDLTNYLSF